MENKVLIRLIVPEIDETFDVFLPVNEVIWKVKRMLVKSINDIMDSSIDSQNYMLINKDTERIYKNNEIIIDTDIKNTTEVLLISL